MDQLNLLDAVREVCLLANTEHPERVTQAAFNEARAQVDYGEPIPRADKIATRLKVPWRKVLAFANEKDSANTLSKRNAVSRGAHWLTEENIVFALKLVALRLEARSGKKVTTVSALRYQVERERILDQDHAQHSHGAQMRLPTVTQIRVAIAHKLDDGKTRASAKTALQRKNEAWDAALAQAGFDASTTTQHRRAADNLELIERMYEIFKLQPSSTDANRFRLANGIPWNRLGGLPWPESIAAWKKKLRAEGIDPPDKPPPWYERPDYSKDIGAARDGERPTAKRDYRDLDKCLDYVSEYLDQLGPNKRATRNDYTAWVRDGKKVRPHIVQLRQHGTWTELRRKAQERMRERARRAQRP